MTSRRNFLGLLATAPLVAPAMAKAAAQSPRNVNFTEWAGTATEFEIGQAKGFDIIKNAQPGHYYFKNCTKLEMEGGGEIFAIGECIIGPSEIKSDAPNRLHGAYINNEGDAV